MKIPNPKSTLTGLLLIGALATTPAGADEEKSSSSESKSETRTHTSTQAISITVGPDGVVHTTTSSSEDGKPKADGSGKGKGKSKAKAQQPAAADTDAMIDQVIAALKAAGLDEDTIEQMRAQMEKAGTGAAAGGSAQGGQAQIRTIVIGPDGTTTTTESGEAGALDLGKMLQGITITGAGEDGTGAPKVSVSGEVTIVGPDGKVTTSSLGEGIDLGGIISDALRGLDLQNLDLEQVVPEIFSIGPALLQQAGAAADSDGDDEEIAELREELEEQRALLEAILKKLEDSE